MRSHRTASDGERTLVASPCAEVWLVRHVMPTARQLDPGLGLTAPPLTRLVPLMSQIAVWPFVFWKRMSEPPPPVPIACQLGPGLATTPPLVRSVPLVPPISQIATLPFVFCNRMSEWLVVVEVAGSDHFPTRPGIGHDSAARQMGPVHLPDRHLAVRVLQQNVGIAVVIEVAGSDCFPARPGIGDEPAASQAGPVRFPNRDLAVRVLQQNVGLAVVVEVAGSDRIPAPPGIGAKERAADQGWPRSFPSRRPARSRSETGCYGFLLAPPQG